MSINPSIHMFLTGWPHQTCHVPISSWICLIANTVTINRKDFGFQGWHSVHTDLIQCFKGNSLDQRGIFLTKMSNYFTEIKSPIHLCKPVPAKHVLLIFPAGKKMKEGRLRHRSNTDRSTKKIKLFTIVSVSAIAAISLWFLHIEKPKCFPFFLKLWIN